MKLSLEDVEDACWSDDSQTTYDAMTSLDALIITELQVAYASPHYPTWINYVESLNL